MRINYAKRGISWKFFAIAVALALLSGYLILAKYSASAATTIINVTTFTDEDANPGTGCSLYEAAVSANTATAYGGCTAGDASGPNIIQLAAGTYARDDAAGPTFGLSYPDDMAIRLNGSVSVVGAGADQTFVDGYGFIMSGDQTSSLEKLSVTASTSYNQSVYVWVYGSNKTLLDVDISNSAMIPAGINFSSGAPIENILIERVDIQATTSTNPSSYMYCSDCSNVTIKDSSIGAGYSAGLTMGDEIKFINSTFYVTACSGSISIYAGDNSLVDGLDLVKQDYSCMSSSTVDIDHATSVKNLNIDSGESGGTISVYIDTPLMDGIKIKNDGTVSFNNEFASSVIENVNIDGSGVIFGWGGSMMAAERISNVTIASKSYTVAYVDKAGSVVLDKINITSSGVNSYIRFNIGADEVDIENLSIMNYEPSGQHGNLSIEAGVSRINNLKLRDTVFTHTDAVDSTVENFTVEGPSILESLNVDATGDVIFKNGYVSGARSGVVANNASTLAVENVQFNDLGTDPGSYMGAVYATDVDHVNISKITVNNATQNSTGSVIRLEGGSVHNITNATIFNSSSGVYVESANPVTVNINNSTIVNNQDSALHQRIAFPSSLLFYASGAGLITSNISNSIIGGSSPYTPCIGTDDFATLNDVFGTGVQLNVDNSFSNDPSCVSNGFSLLDTDDFGLASVLADNGNTATLGFEGENGHLQTLAINADSPLIAAGSNSLCEQRDARGFERDLDAGCDIGALQFNYVAPIIPGPGDGDDGNGGDSGSGNSSSDVEIGAPNTGLLYIGNSGIVYLLAGVIIAIAAASYLVASRKANK